MDRQTLRKVRYYTRLHYPVQVVLTDSGFRGTYPDLPGCSFVSDTVDELYARLERVRREWIADQLIAENDVPLPNSTSVKPAMPAPTPRKSVRRAILEQPAVAAL